MDGLKDYTDRDRRFFESIGLLVAGEVTAEKAAEIAGYSFTTYLEILEKKNISPYSYSRKDYEMDLKTINQLVTAS